MQINTPMFKTYKGIRRWLKSWKLHRHSRAAFFKLRPGESLGRHIDEGDYYLTRDRYHLSLQGTYLYTVGDEVHQINPGTFFWFNNNFVYVKIIIHCEHLRVRICVTSIIYWIVYCFIFLLIFYCFSFNYLWIFFFNYSSFK